MNKLCQKTLATAISAAVSASATVGSQASPAEWFSLTQLTSGYMQLAEASCGEGKCSSKGPKLDGKCGEGRCASNEPQPDDSPDKKDCITKKPKIDGKCGEGRCGENGTACETECDDGKCPDALESDPKQALKS